MKFEWEPLYRSSDSTEHTLRAKVLGGWLVRHVSWGEEGSEDGKQDSSTGMVFIPDQAHRWNRNPEDEFF